MCVTESRWWTHKVHISLAVAVLNHPAPADRLFSLSWKSEERGLKVSRSILSLSPVVRASSCRSSSSGNQITGGDREQIDLPSVCEGANVPILLSLSISLEQQLTPALMALMSRLPQVLSLLLPLSR